MPIYHNTLIPTCHVGVKSVMTIGKTVVWAGSERQVQDDWDWDFMLRFGDSPNFFPQPSFIETNDEADKMLPETLFNLPTPAIMDVTWKDYGAPNMTPEWWDLLNKTIKEWPKGDMVIHCFGGHGRTGTALSILAGLNGFHIRNGTKPYTDPIEWVRNRYCEKVVETAEQVVYVRKMLAPRNIKINALSASVLGRQASSTSVASKSYTVGDDTFVHGGVVYKEDKTTGEWVVAGQDDGSYYGSHHKVRTEGPAAITMPSLITGKAY